MNIETIQAWLPIIKDIITSLATVIAAVIAIMGFRTWKKQLHWKTQYDLTQRLLRSTYKVRQALAEVRRFYTTEGEELQAMKEANVEASPDHQITFIRSQKAVYDRRWQKAQEAFTELDSVSLEAEAIWGHAVKENLQPLEQCAGALLATIGFYLDKLDKPPIGFDKEEVRKERQIMFSHPGEKDNFFSNEITNAVRKIENFLKPYLKI
jgi:hypothetical protein